MATGFQRIRDKEEFLKVQREHTYKRLRIRLAKNLTLALEDNETIPLKNLCNYLPLRLPYPVQG